MSKLRELTNHKQSIVDNAIDIIAFPSDTPAPVKYGIKATGKDTGVVVMLDFQNGPPAQVGINGITNESLLAVVEDRLSAFQASPFACEENEMALQCVQRALEWLKYRTHNRSERGVEGKLVP